MAVIAGGIAACAIDDQGSVPAGDEQLARKIQSELDAAAKADPASFASARPVRPVLKCVENLGSRQYRAHFGYASSAAATLSIPVGFLNRFWPPPANRGQPTTFAPGTQPDVVQVAFNGSAAAIWVLGNHFAIASRFSKPCPTGGGAGGSAGAGGASGAGGAMPACPASCDDHNPCTVDVCNASTGFVCTNVAAIDGATCDDGNLCTVLDHCQAGVCVPVATKECLPLDDCHGFGSCNPATGLCSPLPLRPDGTDCGAANRCDLRGQCRAGACQPRPATDCGVACDQCTFGVMAGQTDMCSASPEGCFNCFPPTDGCDEIADATDRLLCQQVYACLVAPTHPGTSVPGSCIAEGDPLACWCGTHPATCVSSDAPPTQADGPCLQQIMAAAKTSLAAEIFQRFIDPSFPLGRAVNLAACQDLFCPTACRMPPPPPPPQFCQPLDACHSPGQVDPVTGACTPPPVADGTPCDDGNNCTIGDACRAGLCTSGPVCPVTAGDCQRSGSCSSTLGKCVYESQPDGTVCAPSSCSTPSTCTAGICSLRSGRSCLACDQCTFGVASGQVDVCSSSPEGCLNCFPGTDGCAAIADAGDRTLCENLYACLVAPTHPGSSVPGPCIAQGDPLRCWCGTNPISCLSSNQPPTQANGPCLLQIFAAAKSTDAGTVNAHFIDPNTPLGRAVNLAACRSNFCSPECGVPF